MIKEQKCKSRLQIAVEFVGNMARPNPREDVNELELEQAQMKKLQNYVHECQDLL